MTAVLEVERHYSVAAVADLLGVSKPWVYDRIKSGEFQVVELGDSKAKQRIAASTLQRYLDRRTFGTSSVPGAPEVPGPDSLIHAA